MLRAFYGASKRAAGFTLIELMVVVAIIGILAAIAVPNFLVYRAKSRVSAVVGSSEGVRAALASFAADSPGNVYPTTLNTYALLQAMAQANGSTLPPTATAAGFNVVSYGLDDLDGDGNNETYSLRLTIVGVNSDDYRGGVILVTPDSILRCAGATTASCTP